MTKLAAKNRAATDGPFFVGCGAYKHHIPASVDHIIQRSEFLTTYTPYQPEIAQGTLQTMFEFQTQVAALTGMEVANASMYDGSTACAEAAVMACRVTKRQHRRHVGRAAPALCRHDAHAVRSRWHQGDPARARGGWRTRTCQGRRRHRRLRDRPVAERVRHGDRPDAGRRRRARQGRAARDRVHRSRLARPREDAGRDGRGHCGGRRPVDRRAARLRRAVCRPVHLQVEIHAPDAGPPLRRDGGCRWQARLRADALHARTAYPARQGDVATSAPTPASACWPSPRT